jgi:phytoene dehydrogenase-like protein
MSSSYDIACMGAGHNGLVAAAYLAKAGKKVLVLEAKDRVGGGVVTRELTVPGFKHDQHSTAHIMLSGNPMIQADELGLFSRFGLKYHYADVPYATIFEDQSSIITYRDVDRTCESIARISPRDAEAYRRYVLNSSQMLPMFLQGLYAPPIPMGAMVAMLDQSQEGRDLLNTMFKSSLQVVNEWFEHDKVKIHLLKLVSENLQTPEELGTGLGVYLMPALLHAFGVGQPIGGSGKLSEALVECIQHHGGTVLTGRPVRNVVTRGGRAIGLETEDGERFEARDAVIGAIHPARLDRFFDGLDAELVRRAKAVQPSSFSLFLSHYALAEPLRYHAGPELTGPTMLEVVGTNTLRPFLEGYDALRRGRLPKPLLISGGDNSVNDKTRVPSGRGTAYIVCFAPYELADGGPARWDGIKEQVGNEILEFYRRFSPNLTDANILGRHLDSPLDHERYSPNSFVRGDMHGCAPFFHQTGNYRPIPELGNYTVPGVERFYLVGPFMHPGGGVFGAGRGTAIRICDDLKLNFDKIAGART